jgi:hypothetical protein
MSYAKGGYPTELANKVGHIKLIQDPMVQRLIESFEDHRPLPDQDLPAPSHRVALDVPATITQVITVDGGHQTVPNRVRPERQVGFVQVALQLLKLEDIDYLAEHPMTDPRDVQKMLGQCTHHILAALPVIGVHLPGQTLRESLRESIHRFIAQYELYPAFSYLAYRQWESVPTIEPSMDCYGCGVEFTLPRHQVNFRCPRCDYAHWLSDYLGLCERDSEDRSTEETVSNFRVAMEALAMFSIIIKFLDHESIMGRTLFLLDGPLILRAQLSRLVEPIRDLLELQRSRGRPIHLLGVEKNGEFRGFADEYGVRLKDIGEYFAPSMQYVVESINGRIFDPATYRNRVSYGTKVVARLGNHHVLALNVPTGQFVSNPTPADLLGLDESIRALSRLCCFSHPNALIPIVMANSAASISNRPSNGLLAQFVDSLIRSVNG